MLYLIVPWTEGQAFFSLVDWCFTVKMVLDIFTLLIHGRASAPPRGTSSTRSSLPSSICSRSSLFFFRQEVIRLMIFRKQHRFLFHEKVIVAVFSLFLSTSCFLLKRGKGQDQLGKNNSMKKKIKSVSGQWPIQLAYPCFCNLYILSERGTVSLQCFYQEHSTIKFGCNSRS